MMSLNFSAIVRQADLIKIVNKDNAMRISHRDTGNQKCYPFTNSQCFINYLCFLAEHRNFGTHESGFSHVDSRTRHFPIRCKKLDCLNTCQGFYGEWILLGDFVIVHIFCNTANTVSAHLRLAAVGIEDTHLAICRLRRQYKDKPVRPYAKMPVANNRGDLYRVFNFFFKTIDIDVIVADAMHLCEFHTIVLTRTSWKL